MGQETVFNVRVPRALSRLESVFGGALFGGIFAHKKAPAGEAGAEF